MGLFFLLKNIRNITGVRFLWFLIAKADTRFISDVSALKNLDDIWQNNLQIAKASKR